MNTKTEKDLLAKVSPKTLAVKAGAFTPARFRGTRLFLKRFISNPGAVVGMIILLIIVSVAIFAPFLAPHDPDDVETVKRLRPPFWVSPKGSTDYLLGTDAVGRDILSRIMFGARVSLLIGVISVSLACLLGVTLGLLAGYYGKWVDNLVSRLLEIQLAYPLILFAISITAVLGASLPNLIIVLAIANWPVYTRVVRGQVLSIKQQQYIEAAHAIGCRNYQIIFKHILPNALPSVMVLATLQLATVLILEAGLSFLGLGVEPTIPTWGSMLNEGRNYILTAWWAETFPGLAITLTVLGVNLFGDWLRDVLDPRLRNV